MNEWQIRKMLERLHGTKDGRVRLWLDAADGDGATVSIVIDAGKYELLADECMIVTSYDYTDNAMDAKFLGRTPKRHIGANYIPFSSIKLASVFEDGME